MYSALMKRIDLIRARVQSLSIVLVPKSSPLRLAKHNIQTNTPIQASRIFFPPKTLHNIQNKHCLKSTYQCFNKLLIQAFSQFLWKTWNLNLERRHPKPTYKHIS